MGLSGGIDSVVLLDLLARLRARLGVRLSALHVNHQLSPNAARWAAFCRSHCRRLGIPLRVVKVDVARGNSTEAAARRARYAALRAAAADFIVLAHNRDDQAETVLLNLLRGAGVRGLAAMPVLRRQPSMTVRAARASVVRPLLDVPRSEIERYARTRQLDWVEDESNSDTRYLRNFVRHEIMPLIASRFPACRETLARAARHQSEAAELLDALAATDGGGVDTLPVAVLRRLTQVRAKNLLLSFLAAHGADVPAAQRVEEALRQAVYAKDDARVRVEFGAFELRRFRGELYMVPAVPERTAVLRTAWHGERQVELAALGGVLHMRRGRGSGLSLASLRGEAVTIRARHGGERLQPDAMRPRRTVRNLLQESLIPPWIRDRLPFIYCGDRLACVPGIGIDAAFQARGAEPSVVPEWRTGQA